MGAKPARTYIAPTLRRFGAASVPMGVAVFFGHILLGLVSLVLSLFVDPADWWLLLPICLMSLAFMAAFVQRTLRRNPSKVLYEMSIFLAISGGVYFSFGPLLYVLGPSAAIEYSQSWYPVDAAESIWLTGLNFIGIGLAGVVYSLARLSPVSRLASVASGRWVRVQPTRVFVCFLVLGIFAKYSLVLPYELGLSEVVPDALVRRLSGLLMIALLIGWTYRRAGTWWMGFLTKLTLAGEVLTGLLMFNKSVVLLAVLATGLGYYSDTRRIRSLVGVAVFGAAIYILIGPLVTFGRNELVYRGRGEVAPASLAERFDITVTYFLGGEMHARAESVSGAWWSRLNYLPPQQAAVDFWHEGNGGDDLLRLPWIFVPRKLYPDKPLMTAAGTDLTEKVTRLRNSSTGIGVFLDGYYNLGWIGFVLASLCYGLALRIYANIAQPVMRRHTLAMYPLTFMGIYVGLRADGSLLTDVLGPLVFVLILLTVYKLVSPSGFDLVSRA